jgi:glycosyltransferase involved in cell wall biosynthesis
MKDGHEVMIVSLFEGDAVLPFTGAITSLKATKGSRLVDFQSWNKLNKVIRNFRPDIVQANAGDTLKYVILSKLFFRWSAKVVFRNANLMSAFIRGSAHRQFNTWLLSRCDFFISVSENCRRDLVELYPDAANKSATVPVGTESVEGVAAAPREVAKDEPVFVAVGSFVPEKNHLFLIDIFDRYFRSHAKGYLWLVGDGRLRGDLEKKVSLLNLNDRVRFWGYRNDVVSLLKAADVFIMPSLIEGLPAVILEAMACEVPVVTSAVGGIPEIVENDVTGICIAYPSVDVYVKMITGLLNDRDYKTRLVKTAKETVSKKFTLQKVTGDFVVQYVKLLGLNSNKLQQRNQTNL